MLRLGFKYQIDHIRNEAIHLLQQCFPEDLDDYITVHTSDLLRDNESSGCLTNIYCNHASVYSAHEDCIAVVNLARIFDLDSLLPAAFYACAQLSDEVLFNGYKDSRGEVWKLSSADLQRCMSGQRRLRSAVIQSFQWLLEIPAEECKKAVVCKSFVQEDLVISWRYFEAGDVDALLDNERLNTDLPWQLENKYCKVCVKFAQTHYDSERLATWDALRVFFDLPSPNEPEDEL